MSAVQLCHFVNFILQMSEKEVQQVREVQFVGGRQLNYILAHYLQNLQTCFCRASILNSVLSLILEAF